MKVWKKKRKGPIIIGRGMNARIQKNDRGGKLHSVSGHCWARQSAYREQGRRSPRKQTEANRYMYGRKITLANACIQKAKEKPLHFAKWGTRGGWNSKRKSRPNI